MQALQARTLKRGHAWALLPLDPTAWLVMLSQHHASLQEEQARPLALEHPLPALPGLASSAGVDRMAVTCLSG